MANVKAFENVSSVFNNDWEKKNCWRWNEHSTSAYECRECDVGLCVDHCFKFDHINKDFRQAYQRRQDRREAETSDCD